VAGVTSDEDSDTRQDREVRFSFDYVEDVKAQNESQQLPPQKGNSWVKNNTNIKVPESTTYSSVLKSTHKAYGIPKNHNPKEVYCCLCGGRHSDEECARYGYGGQYGNQKF
jgi:hypothetical protein